MKKVTFSSVILIAAILLASCSSPLALLQSATAEKTAPKAEVAQPVQPVTYTQPIVVQATPPAAPSAETAGLLAAYEGALTAVYEAVNPSVVNIRVVQKASGLGFNLPQGQESPGIPGFPELPFGLPNLPNDQGQGQPFQEGLGSGFVWDQQGYIVTNNHVVEGADKIEITFADGTIAPANVVGADPDSDLAVVKVDLDADKLRPVQFVDSTQIKVGELAIAIGNPFGLEGTMTTGIVSAIGRMMPVESNTMGGPSYSIPDVIQTDASINPGNSGGLLVNDQGLVMGVTFAIESSTRSSAGIGFVIPSSIVVRVVPALIKDGKYEHTYLGITGGTLIPAVAEAMKLDPDQRGVLVGEVSSGAPAAQAGLRGSESETTIDGQKFPVGGDVIYAIDGQPVTKMADIISYLAGSTAVGQEVALSILRDGKQMEVKVTLAARPDRENAESSSSEPTETSDKAWLGITGGMLTPEIAQAMKLDRDQVGVLVAEVATGSPAESAGMLGSDRTETIGGQPVPLGGDVITAIDGQQITSMNDLGRLLADYQPGDKINLTILRDGKQLDLTVTLGERPATQ